jgi:hypothetical protein
MRSSSKGIRRKKAKEDKPKEKKVMLTLASDPSAFFRSQFLSETAKK